MLNTSKILSFKKFSYQDSLKILVDSYVMIHYHYPLWSVNLSDPLTAIRYKETAHILIRKNFVEQLDQNIRDELEELTLSTKIISAMDYMII